MNLNKTFILGRLTQDPQRRNLPSGQPVVNFSLATNRFYTSREGQKQEETEFHNVVIFGKLAETASQYLNKGSLVLIEGRLKTRSWDDPSGQKRYKTEVIAERMQLGPRTSQSSQASFRASPFNPQVKTAFSEEEIPVIEETPVVSERTAKKEQIKEELNEEGPASQTIGKEPNEEEIDVKDIPF